MISYDIAKLARRVRPYADDEFVYISPIFDRLGTVESYAIALRKIVNALADEVRTGIIPLYRDDIKARSMQTNFVMDQKRVMDAASDLWFARLKALAVTLTRNGELTAMSILGLEAERHTKDFMEKAKSALSIDISSVIMQSDLTEYMQIAAQRNAALIKSLSDDMVRRIEAEVLDNSLKGNSVKTLRATLIKEFGIARNRATLIAYDQTSKLNSDLNRIRQEQAGIFDYEWMTSEDERVRPLHRTLNGKIYTHGQPTGAERGAEPGQPVRCRCVARGIVVFGSEAKKAIRKPMMAERV